MTKNKQTVSEHKQNQERLDKKWHKGIQEDTTILGTDVELDSLEDQRVVDREVEKTKELIAQVDVQHLSAEVFQDIDIDDPAVRDFLSSEIGVDFDALDDNIS